MLLAQFFVFCRLFIHISRFVSIMKVSLFIHMSPRSFLSAFGTLCLHLCGSIAFIILFSSELLLFSVGCVCSFVCSISTFSSSSAFSSTFISALTSPVDSLFSDSVVGSVSSFISV
eukprot:UN31875